MVVVPLSKPANDSATTPGNVESETMNRIGFAAGGTLVTAGLLLLAGERRAGIFEGQVLHILRIDHERGCGLPGRSGWL